MSLTIREERQYEQGSGLVFDKLVEAVNALEGKIEVNDQAAGRLEGKFDKKILGKVLGQRTQFMLSVQGEGEGSRVAVEAVPLDAIGRPLKFGERKGVNQTVVSWIWAHLEHRLKG